MAKLFMRSPGRGRNPAELAIKASQTLEKIPYESSSTKIVDELAKILQQIKVGLRIVCCITQRGQPLF
jgi:hypothetical protein